MCRRFIAFLLLCMPLATTHAESLSDWFQTTTQHLESAWDQGRNELYIPLYTYHMPYAYSQDKINEYTEYPMGIGFGRGLMNESGNWEGIYGMTFKDSHGIYQYMVGYGWIPMWNIGNSADWKYGVGATAFIMSRQDIMNTPPSLAYFRLPQLAIKISAFKLPMCPADKTLETCCSPGPNTICPN